MPIHNRSSDAERFARRVDRTTTPDGCWLWTGTPNRHGYGYFNTGTHGTGTYKPVPPHRFALEQALGRPLRSGMKACHTCDIPMCVRNDEVGTYEVDGLVRVRWGHLWEGSTKDNALDAKAKGRLQRGSARWSAKLSEDQIRTIRQRVAAGDVQWRIADDYGIWQSTVNRIAHGQSWVHVG